MSCVHASSLACRNTTRFQAREAAVTAGEEIADADVFDSNVITPGTQFMTMVGLAGVYGLPAVGL